MKNLLLLISTTLLFSHLNGQEPLTAAERSGYLQSSSYSEVMEFLDVLDQQHDQARMEVFARSIEGREVPLMIIADPMPASYEELEGDERVVVYLQANIHAGEVEGKEAALMLARDLLSDELPATLRAGGDPADRVRAETILDKVIILVCPNVNPDGNEKLSPENRTRQNGPEIVGVRHNGQFLDMNRDAIKLETPELRGVVEDILNKWDPAITVDCHATNGSFHEEPVTFAWMSNPNGSRELINYMRDRMMPSVRDSLRDKYGVENCYYGNFIDRMDMQKGWIYHAAEPRYLVNYIGLRNRLAILNENYMYADFETRVLGAYHLMLSILEYAADHGQEIKTLLADTDRAYTQRHSRSPELDSFAISYEVRPTPEKVRIKAIETDTIPGMRGYWRYKQGEGRFTLDLDYYADYYPTGSLKLPYAYLLGVPDPEVLEVLLAHGIHIERLNEERELEVERFNVTSFEGSKRPFQGHYLSTIDGEFESISQHFPEGTYLVRTAQPLGNLAAHMLEPQAKDGLLTWNFFDRYLVKQWYPTYNPYPVYRLMPQTGLNSTRVN